MLGQLPATLVGLGIGEARQVGERRSQGVTDGSAQLSDPSAHGLQSPNVRGRRSQRRHHVVQPVGQRRVAGHVAESPEVQRRPGPLVLIELREPEVDLPQAVQFGGGRRRDQPAPLLVQGPGLLGLGAFGRGVRPAQRQGPLDRRGGPCARVDGGAEAIHGGQEHARRKVCAVRHREP